MGQRALLAALGLPVALFALWGAWEIARYVPQAPQAVLGAAFFLACGLAGLAAVVLGASSPPS
ncbi:MAG TPA: hypothetical protein VKZ60_06710 [Chloroflexota bacterium]|jgi:hypothetical protein|nr:hypothetical protein [Chloroflexota bacterium]